MNLTHIATREGRLSSFLQNEMSMSTGLINRLKWHEKILVNGKPEHTDFPVQIGDTITVLLDAPQTDYPAQQGDLTVLYEDDHVLRVDKRPGLAVHPHDGAEYGRTQIDHIQAYLYQKREWRPREEHSFTNLTPSSYRVRDSSSGTFPPSNARTICSRRAMASSNFSSGCSLR